MAIRKVFVRSGFNYDVDDVSRETAVLDDEDGESLAQQSFKDECDINTIVRRFGVTRMLPQAVVPPTYGMFGGIFDFHSAMNAIAAARESFDSMSASVRARFHNNPQEFVEFCSDEKNIVEMRAMGLAVPAPIVDTPVTADVPPKEASNVSDSKGGAVGSPKAAAGSDKAG